MRKRRERPLEAEPTRTHDATFVRSSAEQVATFVPSPLNILAVATRTQADGAIDGLIVRIGCRPEASARSRCNVSLVHKARDVAVEHRQRHVAGAQHPRVKGRRIESIALLPRDAVAKLVKLASAQL